MMEESLLSDLKNSHQTKVNDKNRQMFCPVWDDPIRQRLIYTVCIYGAFVMLGWLRGMFGPTFIDIQLISNVGLDEGSWIVTTLFIGVATGSLIGGILYDKVNRKFLFATCSVVLAAMMVVTPWCSIYGSMLFVHFFQGVTQGVIDTVGNAEILLMWRDSRMVYFGLDLVYIIGSFISPLVAAPFVTVQLPNTVLAPYNSTAIPASTSPTSSIPLITPAKFDTTLLSTVPAIAMSPLTTAVTIGTSSLFTVPTIATSSQLTTLQTISTTPPFTVPATTTPRAQGGFEIPTITHSADTFSDMQEFLTSSSSPASTASTILTDAQSLIYVPFLVTGFVIVCSAFTFLCVYRMPDQIVINENKNDSKDTTNEEYGTKLRVLPFKIKMASLIIMSAMFLVFTGYNETFSNYLTVFCVDYLSWTTTDGAFITFFVNIAGMISVCMALFLKCLDSVIYAGIHCVFLVLCLVGILFSSLYYNDIGVWISVTIFGFFKSMLFSLLYTWTNEYITPVTGKISSLFMLTSMLGGSVNPILLGYLMERFTYLWFCYLFLLESLIVLFLYIAAVFLTRYIRSRYRNDEYFILP